MKRRLAILIGILFLSGCRPLPPYQKPTVPITNNWKEGQTDADEQPAPIFEHWWLIFNDPHLEALENLTLANNPSLKVALWRISEAWAKTQAAIALLYPSINFAPNTLNQLQLINISQFSGSNPLLPATTTIDPLQRIQTKQYNLPFIASYEFDLWGRLAYGVDSAYATAQAEHDAWLATRLSLTAAVANAYFKIRTYDTEEKVLTDTIKSRQNAFDINKTRYNAGLINYADVSRAETELWLAKADLSTTLQLRAEQEHILAVLVGEIPANFNEQDNPLFGNPPTIPLILPSEVILRRPDLAQAEREIAAAYANEGISVASLFPSLSIETDIGYSSPLLSHLLNWKARLFSLAWTGLQTIYDAGRKEANISASRAQFEQTVNSYADQVLTAFKEVENALSNLKWQTMAMNQLDSAVKSAQISKDLASERYQKGLVSYLEVIDAERTLLETQLRAVGTMGDRFTSTVDLIKAIGGSWETSLDSSCSDSE